MNFSEGSEENEKKEPFVYPQPCWSLDSQSQASGGTWSS